MEDAAPNQLVDGQRATEAELDRQAAAETEAGIGVPVEEVEAWVSSTGMPNELPMPKARKIR